MTGAPPGVGATDPDLRDFHAAAVPRGRRDLLVFLALVEVANLAYWATDGWVFRDAPALLEPLAAGRLQLAAIGLVVAAVVWAWPRLTYAAATVGALTGMVVFAQAMGACGGPSGPWLNFTFPYFLLPAGATLRPLPRLAATAALVGLLLLGYFGPHPEHLADPLAPMGLAHLGYVAVLGWALGVVADRARLVHFLTARALDTERAHLADEVRRQTEALVQLSRRLDAAREVERAEIARDLHDDLAQTLTATRLITRHALRRFEQDPAAAGPSLEAVAAGLEELADQTRGLLHRIRPLSVDDRALAGALDALTRRTGELAGIDATFRDEAPGLACAPEVATTTWRCAQELLTNVARHARAASVTVVLRSDASALSLRVDDDGVGFAPGATGGLGLLGVRERAQALGGEAFVDSRPGDGTRARVRIPLERNP